ncbi:VWA domain-containing protein, partial [bacterium]|nr:VWA domain-containing protein [candidate division CSSED10-310 bacterium]
ELQENDTVPNKDFILRYNIAGKSPESALLTHAGSNGGFFSLVIQPQADFDQGEITPKEMFFVVDCSGSMSGAPITKAKEAMKHAIANMNPEDSFQIIRFSSAASQFSPYPLSNTPQNIKKAMTYIDAMQGSGGTQMIEGIKASLDYPRDPQKLRFVLFMTDGYIGNETQILAAIESRLNNARLFSFGVGTSVNHYLLDRMAETGRGFVQYVRPDEDTEKAVNLFYERIRNPLLTDIFINWNGLNVQDVSPAAIPDLFSSQPVILHGRYGNPGKATIVIHGKIAGKPWYQEIDATLPEKQPRHDVLETLWARTRIKTLMSKMYDGPSNDIVKEITELGITYRIMSQYTAFIAVTEEIRCDADGNRQTVHIPVNLPEMVEYEGIFGECNEKKVCGRLSLPAAIPQQAPSGTLVSSSSELLSVKDEYDLEPIKYKENHNQNKPCKLPVRSVSFHCSMVSGQINSAEVISALEALSTEIDALLKSYPPGRLILVLNVNSKGKPSKVETIKNVYHDLSLEESLSKLLMSKLNLTSGNGQANITIIVS